MDDSALGIGGIVTGATALIAVIAKWMHAAARRGDEASRVAFAELHKHVTTLTQQLKDSHARVEGLVQELQTARTQLEESKAAERRVRAQCELEAAAAAAANDRAIRAERAAIEAREEADRRRGELMDELLRAAEQRTKGPR